LSMRREGEGGDKGEGREIYCPHDAYFKFSGARPADDISCARATRKFVRAPYKCRGYP
jgi:hypothetical protein